MQKLGGRGKRWRGGTNITTNFAVQNWLFLDDTIRTFWSSTVSVGKISEDWERCPAAEANGGLRADPSELDDILQFFPELKHFSIFWFKFLLENIILYYCNYVGVHLKSAWAKVHLKSACVVHPTCPCPL